MTVETDLDLAFVKFVYNEVGYEYSDTDPFEDIATVLRGNAVSYTDVGQTRWFTAGRRAFVSESGLSEEDYRRFDSNIAWYLDRINSYREDSLRLRYYQYVAVLFTEVVLDKYSNGSLQDEFNAFIETSIQSFEKDVLKVQGQFNKLAYWMATGSGKTYVMHINLLQVKQYLDIEAYDNLIVIASTEQVSEQHRVELQENGFKSAVLGSGSADSDTVKVTDIYKLQDANASSNTSDTVDFTVYGQKNLIFVDEGHKGLGSRNSSASGWIEKRDYLVEDGGFAFEYSATFASSLQDAAGYQLYSRSIVFEYPYGRFHSDGFGKDFNISNTSLDTQNDFEIDDTDTWLMHNLLLYYEKIRMFEESPDIRDTYNVDRPLAVFVGSNVNSVTRRSSDIDDIVEFLSNVLQNGDQWVTDILTDLLEYTGQFGSGGLFDGMFEYVRSVESDPESMYTDLLRRIFKSEQASHLELIRLKNVEDEELALSTDGTDSYFGLISIGDPKDLFDRVSRTDTNIITRENEVHTASLFNRIDNPNTDVDMLLGSKKFAEGWDSTRPSTLGLLNLGRSKGPLVVQIFGRGVRVTGKNADGKRSMSVEQPHQYQVSRLETLDVFGVRADYIEVFRDHLKSERVSVDNTIDIPLQVSTTDIDSKPSTELKIPEFNDVIHTENIPTVELTNVIKNGLQCTEEDSIPEPSIQVKLTGKRFTSNTETEVESTVYNHTLEDIKLKLNNEWVTVGTSIIDTDAVLNHVIEYKQDHGYSNIIVNRDAIELVLSSQNYTIQAPKHYLRAKNMDDVPRLEKLCANIVTQYIENVYTCLSDSVTSEVVTIATLDTKLLQSITPTGYNITIKEPENSIASEIDRNLIQNTIETKYSLYNPIPILSDSTPPDLDIISMTPEGIDNDGEKRFVDAVQHHIESGCLQDYETSFIRNQANKGISIPTEAGEFYPDFIIWIQSNDHQHIIFADPHGLILGGTKSEFDAINKINTLQTDDPTVSIHACLFARTNSTESLRDAKQTIAESNNMTIPELETNNIYFIGEHDSDNKITQTEVKKMLSNVLPN